MTHPVDGRTAAGILDKNGIRPSIQRTLIYQSLRSSVEHPTAEMLYLQLAPAIPTLSRTTVYNTLKLFSDKKLAQTLLIEGDELRYDADTAPHVHFKCRICGQVHDAATSNAERQIVKSFYDYCRSLLPEGFILEKAQACLWGVCAGCRNGCSI